MIAASGSDTSCLPTERQGVPERVAWVEAFLLSSMVYDLFRLRLMASSVFIAWVLGDQFSVIEVGGHSCWLLQCIPVLAAMLMFHPV